jgi:hypothetical protein
LDRRLAAIAGALLIAVALACGAITAAEGEVLDTDSPASIEVLADGGIAALHILNHVDSTTGQAHYSVGPICPSSGTCQPRDTLEGQLTRAQVDALFARAAESEFRALHADYGTTTQGADMMGYTVIIRANDRTRTIRADDGTMPSLLAQWVNDVRGAVVEAVRK